MMSSPTRARYPARILLALLPFALHGLAREVDHAVGLLLHTTLDLPGFVPVALSLVDWGRAARATLLWSAAGAALYLVLAIASRAQAAWPVTLGSSAWLFAPLLLRPALTLLALGALAWNPAYPYGFTLPVALTQDWGFAQDAAAAAAIVAGLVPYLARLRPRLRIDWRPHPPDVFLLAFLVYGLLTPDGARHFEAHPGNEPKYLRMAVALGHGLTLDIDTLTAPMEELPVTPLAISVPRAARRVAAESARLCRALATGRLPTAAAANEARPDAHLTVRARDGGAYHVLAPGPALLLAPALRLDRAWNLAYGTPGRLGFTLLLWNLLAAGVVAATFVLAREVARSTGLALAVAAAVALTPPLLLYSFQFYPELPAALALAWTARRLTTGAALDTRACALLGLACALLPWLHQKYLPLGVALVLWATLATVDGLARLRALVALLLPPALSAALIALYNFALTGSPRPDALFRALGREGVGLAHVGQGALGLLVDARYGLLPYVPWLLLALAGLRCTQTRALRAVWPAAAVYYATVAAAENWTGSISNLGRFLLPLVPLGAACAAPALRAATRPAALVLVLALGAWSARLATLLWADPLAANDSGVLLATSTFADGNVYLPTLLLSRWSDAAPALAAQLALGALLAALGAWVLRPTTRAVRAASPARALALITLALLAAGFALERWPARRGRARYADALAWSDDTTVFVAGAARIEGVVLVATGGRFELLLRSRTPRAALTWRLDGATRVAVGDTRAVSWPATSVLHMPLGAPLALRGRRGQAEVLARQHLTVDRPVELRPAEAAPHPAPMRSRQAN